MHVAAPSHHLSRFLLILALSAAPAMTQNAAELYERGEWQAALDAVRSEIEREGKSVKRATIGAWCMLRIAGRDGDTTLAREAVKWLDGLAAEPPPLSDLGIAIGCRILAEGSTDDVERTRWLGRATALSDAAARAQPNAAPVEWTSERVRLAALRGGLDEALEVLRAARTVLDRQRSLLLEELRRHPSSVQDAAAQVRLDEFDRGRAATAGWLAERLEAAGRDADVPSAIEHLLALGAGVGRDDRALRALLTAFPDEPQLVPACISGLTGLTDATVRAAAARGLGRLGADHAGAQEALSKALIVPDEDPRVLCAVIDAFGMLGQAGDEAQTALAGLRTHEDPAVGSRAAAVARSLGQLDLAFVLTATNVLPDPERLFAAARELGVALATDEEDETTEDAQAWIVDGGPTLIIALLRIPHPDAAALCRGPTAPEREIAMRAPGHYVVSLLHAQGTPRERDVLLAKLTAAVVRSSPAVAAMFGRGAVFHSTASWRAAIGADQPEALMTMVLVDVTIADEGDGHRSLLTHGMREYGRQELLLHAPAEQTAEAYELILELAAWLTVDTETRLRPGDTAGRTADEKLSIGRAPNPVAPEETVILLNWGD